MEQVMIKEDRELIREMLDDVLGTHSAVTQGKFDVIKTKLDLIETQTTKTNGTVIRHGNEIQKLVYDMTNHGITCPQGNRISKLEQENLRSMSIKKFLLGSLAVIVSITGLLTLIYELFIKEVK